MHRIFLAIRIFFLTLFKAAIAEQVEQLLGGAQPAAEPAPPQPKQPPAPKPPVRSEAITLLATLQREARFVDFIQESLAGYSDAQIGAVARDVHRDCGRRARAAVRPEAGGAARGRRAGGRARRFRRRTLPPDGQRGRRTALPAAAWSIPAGKPTKCELPTWSGSKDSARVIAPAEVEIK